MKKILIFSTAYLPYVGGAEIAVKELTDRMLDYEFDLITARLDKKLPNFEKLGRVNVYRIGLGNKFDKFLLPFLGCWRALGLDKSRHYQIIFSLMASQASIAAAWLKMLHSGKKLLLNLQEGDEEEHLKRYVLGSDWLYSRLIKPWHLLVFKKADLVIAISESLKQRAAVNGVKCQLAVVPNGVDLKKFSIFNFQFSIKDIKNKLGFSENDKVLITASRLVKKNAVDDVIKALEYLPENIKFLILGDGPDRKMLEDLVVKLKLQNRVIFKGAYDNDDLPQYLAIADVFVRPSLSEGQGIAFLEAMAAGVPVVATPVGGIVDFLTDNETGLFCKVNNPQSIAEQVKALLNNKELAEKIKTSASQLVEKDYDWNLIAVKMKKIFETIMN